MVTAHYALRVLYNDHVDKHNDPFFHNGQLAQGVPKILGNIFLPENNGQVPELLLLDDAILILAWIILSGTLHDTKQASQFTLVESCQVSSF